MSRKIRATRRCAAPSCHRIEFVPSRRAAFAWLAWLMLAGTVLFVAVDLPLLAKLPLVSLLAKLPLVSLLAGAAASVRRFVMLQGPRAVRAVEWGGPAGFQVCLGEGTRLPADPWRCQRYGSGLWLLRFVTPSGKVGLVVETGIQPPGPLRRLSRSLDWGSGTSAGPPGAQ